MKRIITLFAMFFTLAAGAQGQIDFRGLFSLTAEKKLTPGFSVTAMGIGLLTYDFNELGFGMIDGGVKYKLNRNFSTNINYRFILRRNLDNFYDNRHVLYADLDYAKGFNRWSLGATARLQVLYYSHLFDGYRDPRIYSRNKLSLHYRINYYWQPFAEAEVFIPIHYYNRKLPDQIRGSIGTSFTVNDHVKFEGYIQMQQQINRSPRNTYYVLAINSYFRF